MCGDLAVDEEKILLIEWLGLPAVVNFSLETKFEVSVLVVSCLLIFIVVLLRFLDLAC